MTRIVCGLVNDGGLLGLRHQQASTRGLGDPITYTLSSFTMFFLQDSYSRSTSVERVFDTVQLRPLWQSL